MDGLAAVSNEDLVRAYRESRDSETCGEVVRKLRCRLWPSYEQWVREKFPQWVGPEYGANPFMRHDHDFEACFDDALLKAVREYDPARGSFEGLFRRILKCDAIDLIRHLSNRNRRHEEWPEQMVVDVPGNEGLRSLSSEEKRRAFDEAVAREPEDCQALLKIYEDSVVQGHRGWYAAAKPMLELQGYRKTEGGWKTTFHRNKKRIFAFLEGKGMSGL